MIATLFDYGAGNLHSLAKALAVNGLDVAVESDPVRAAGAQLLVLPGVGAFAPAAARLAPGRERMRARLAAGLPCVGICLGMQLLFDSSEEGAGDGLGVFPGRVTRLAAARVPQIGWNTVEPADGRAAVAPLPAAYFAHGFACRPADDACVAAWTTHETDRFAAVVRNANTIGVQFHPEKSSRAGVAFLGACVRAVAS
jgi:glutamine amidotransferase